MDFSAATHLQGGQYLPRVETECLTGQRSGEAKRNTVVFAVLEMTGAILATVRSESLSTLIVTYADAVNMKLRVTDWRNKPVPALNVGAADADGYDIKGSGSIDFHISGAGVYRIEGHSILVAADTSGQGTVNQAWRTTLRAGVKQENPSGR